uniref:C2 domain-containing protein n=1 Tax=Sinocyclocheilus grahami TaxID=75366 RepID=A0A672JYS1_SINGR
CLFSHPAMTLVLTINGSPQCPKKRTLWGDYFSQTDMYVKVLRNHKDFLGETSVIWNQNSPTWNWKFENRLEVWDRDNKWDDNLLGACNIQLKAKVKSDFCRLNHGLLKPFSIMFVCSTLLLKSLQHILL